MTLRLCDSPDMSVELDEEPGDVLVAHVHGPLDLATAPALDRALQRYLAVSTAHRILLDLTDVEFLDCKGVAVLVRLAQWAKAHQGCERPYLLGLSRCGRRVLGLVEVIDVFSVHDTIRAALVGAGATTRDDRVDRREQTAARGPEGAAP